METIYSLSGEMPRAEETAAAEPGASPGPASLVRGSVRQACVVRKISAAGALVHVDHIVEPGERLELDLMSGDELDGTIVWRRGSEVGMRFDAPVDIFAIIARDIVSQPGERRRMPRVELICPALLETAAGTELVTTRDIAQGGAKIDTPFALAPGTPALITLEGFRPIDAVARWSEGLVVGLAFVPELSWQEAMLWLKTLRQAAPGAGWASPAFAAPPAAAPASPPRPGEASVELHLPARVREGTRRWSIEVASITARSVEFESFAALKPGSLLWIVLPGLEGWPARIASAEGYRFICEFTQPLHPAVLERILDLAKSPPA